MLLLAAGCSSPAIVVDVPFESSDEAAVIIVESRRATEAYAVDSTFREQSPVLKRITDLSDSDFVRATVLFYEQQLSQLGLPPGALQIEDMPEEGVPLPDASVRISQRTISPTNAGSWSEIDRLPPELSAIRVAGGQTCATFEMRDLELQGETLLAGGAVLDGETAMLVVSTTSVSEPRFYRVTAGSARRLQDSSLDGFHAERASGGRDAIFLSGTLNGVPAVAVRNSADVVGLIPPRVVETKDHLFRAILAPPDDGDDSAQFYTVDALGNVERFISEPLSEPRWDSFVINPDVRSGTVTSMAWNGPADVYFISLDGKNIVHYTREQYVLQDTDLLTEIADGTTAFSVLARIEGVGVFAGMTSGHLLAFTGTRWEQFRRGGGTRSMMAIAPFRDGFLAGTINGQVLQYSTTAGFCENDMYVGQDRSIQLILELEDVVLVAGTGQTGGEVFVSILTPL